MKHLIEFMKTPLAAPETAGLRTMRKIILGCCAVLLPLMLLLGPARAVGGNGVIGVIAGLLAVLAAVVPVYVVTKLRADDAYLDAFGGEGEGE